MKNKVFVSVLLFVSLFHTWYNFRTTHGHKYDTNLRVISLKSTEHKIATNRKLRVDKRKLKKEIKRRKKLHRGLLALYNKDFEEKYLQIIASNSLKIEKLKSIIQRN